MQSLLLNLKYGKMDGLSIHPLLQVILHFRHKLLAVIALTAVLLTFTPNLRGDETFLAPAGEPDTNLMSLRSEITKRRMLTNELSTNGAAQDRPIDIKTKAPSLPDFLKSPLNLAIGAMGVVSILILAFKFLRPTVKTDNLLPADSKSTVVRSPVTQTKPYEVKMHLPPDTPRRVIPLTPPVNPPPGPDTNAVPLFTMDGKTLRDQLKQFFGWIPSHIMEIQSNCDRLSQSTTPATHREYLTELESQVKTLKKNATLPQLRPVSQMVNFVTAYLSQLLERTDEITPSRIKTLSEGLRILGNLCVPELRADLTTNPPIRVLAADDDSITRYALTAMVKKAFPSSEFAESGQEALAMALRKKYDLILLDIRIPGMNCLDVCSRIRESILNSNTPILFVTSRSDLRKQSESLVEGGNGLIEKPYLSGEIVVKSLQLILKERLKERENLVEESNRSILHPRPSGHPQGDLDSHVANPEAPGQDTIPATLITARNPRHLGIVLQNSPRTLSIASEILTEMRLLLQSAGQTLDETAKMEKLSEIADKAKDLSDFFQHLTKGTNLQLCLAVEQLLVTLAEKPANANASTLETATAAVDLFLENCLSGPDTTPVESPPLRALVVDDDVTCRSAVIGALKSKSMDCQGVDNGQHAISLSTRELFDVIILDVDMPDMNGYTTCSKILESPLNRATPVVFLTSHVDMLARARSQACGGSDFLVKPFLMAEVLVKTMTYALLHQQNHQRATASGESLPSLSPS